MTVELLTSLVNILQTGVRMTPFLLQYEFPAAMLMEH